MDVKRGELIGIVGRVGSGKSSFLSAILGEMDRFEDEGQCVVVANSIGYAPQQPWIQNKTVRDNILFGKNFDRDHYEKTLQACALSNDLLLLSAGDMTEIGEKGINLSGGQKARVALARAVYQKADLYILDDTLSAVDAHVGAHIFDRVISSLGGLIGKSTRLFALNTLSFLRNCDRIVVMHEGRIHEIGTFNQLKQNREGPFADLVKEYLAKKIQRQKNVSSNISHNLASCDANINEQSEIDAILGDISGSPLSESVLKSLNNAQVQNITGLASSIGADTTPLENSYKNDTSSNQISLRRRTISTTCDNASLFSEEISQTPQETLSHGKLIEEEETETGKVSFRISKQYSSAFGFLATFGYIIVTFGGISFFDALSNVWLADWTSIVERRNGTSNVEEDGWYLIRYGLIEFASVMGTVISGIILTYGAYNASLWFHDKFVDSLLRAPMAFFEQTLMGRIINRLGSDIDKIDESVPIIFSILFSIIASALSSLISISIMVPSLSIPIAYLLIVFVFLAQFYNIASVQFRRLTSKAYSHTCSYIQDSYRGVDSIRAFSLIERFRRESCKVVDLANESLMAEICTNRYLQVRMDLITEIAVFIFVLVAIILAEHDAITLGALAMIISTGFSFSGYLGEIARFWREANTNIVSVERIDEYIRLEPEAEWRSILRDPKWPSEGRITFCDLSFRYRPNTDIVLHDLNFEIQPGEKVGIVERTGAGTY